MLRICLVSNRLLRPDRSLVALLEEAAAAGVDRILLREKDLGDRDLYELACATVRACRPHGCKIFVSGRADIAAASELEGVHLPSDGISVAEARAAGGVRLEIGVSTHSIEEAKAAEQAGADYVFLGPVYPTIGKPAPLGIGMLEDTLNAVRMPVYAIGGVDRDSVQDLARLPIAGVAVIRGILAQPDIPAAVGVLRAKLSRGLLEQTRAASGPPETGGAEEPPEEDEDQGEGEQEDEEPDDEGGWGYH